MPYLLPNKIIRAGKTDFCYSRVINIFVQGFPVQLVESSSEAIAIQKKLEILLFFHSSSSGKSKDKIVI